MLTGYTKRKRIDITAADVQDCYNNPTAATIACYKDTYLDLSAATTNRDAGSLNIRIGGTTNRIIIEFDGSAYTAGNDLMQSALLSLYFFAHGANATHGRTYTVYKLNRNFTENEATWNKYTSANSWATAGGMGSGDYEPTTPAPVSVTVPTEGWMTWDITAIVKDAITNASSKVRLIIKDSSETGSTDYYSVFVDSENATTGLRPKLVINYLATTTPSVPSNYKLSFNVFKEAPTVEPGSWTVNGKTYRSRIPFTIKVNDALSAVYAREVLIDTYSLIAGGFFANSTPATAESVEFADEDGANPLAFWVQTALGVVTGFNTPNTRYWIGLNGFSANTDYTYYLYVDPLITDASSNCDPASVFSFFDDFTTDAANLTAFLAAYTKWEQDTTNAPTVAVASSVLTLTGGAAEFRGIATKLSGGFTQQNFRLFYRVTAAPAVGTLLGMLDENGVSDPQDGICMYYQDATKKHSSWLSGDITNYNLGLPSTSWISGISAYGGDWQQCLYKSCTDGTTPDSALMNSLLDVYTDSALKLNIASTVNAAAIAIDWIAVAPQINKPPIIFFPDITYSSTGNIYLDDQSLHWPYDVAFTDGDGETLLKYYRDPSANLTKAPGITDQVQVRVTDALSSSQSIYVYYGNDDVTADGDNGMIADDTFADSGNYHSDFDAVTDMTVKAGTWSVESVTEPILSAGASQGNALGITGVNGGSRLWARGPSVMMWAANDYRLVIDNSLWEISEAWPAQFNPFIASTTSLTEPYTNLSYWNIYPEGHDYLAGTIPCVFKKFGTKAYFLAYSSKFNAFEVFSSSDPTSDPADWTKNTNGPFFTGAWVRANSSTDFTTYAYSMNIDVVKDGSTYRIFLAANVDTSGTGIAGTPYYTTTVDPENWNPSTSFTYVGKISSFNFYHEDPQIVYDGSQYWYWYYYDISTLTIKYKKLDTSSQTFPTGTWGSATALDMTLPPFCKTYGGPKIMNDGTHFWIHFWGQGVGENFSYGQTFWQPDWITNGYADTPAGPWTPGIVSNKLYQAATTGVSVDYITGLTFGDGEIISEVILGHSATSGKEAGIAFRYNSTTEQCYAAFVSYNTSTYVAIVTLYKNTGSWVLLSTYTFPAYPIPQYQPGFPIRLRIKAYGRNISVDYSTWGNQWINAITTTDVSHSSGKVGLICWGTECWFNDLRIKQMVLTEPYANEGIPIIFITDTGEGADGLANIRVGIALSDSGAGADAFSPGVLAGVPLADTGVGSDIIAQIVNLVSVLESCAGADGLANIIVSLALSDNGEGADTVPAIIANVGVADSGAGADGSPAIAVSIGVTDSGAGADGSPSITVNFPLSDNGTGSDGLPGINVNVPLSDAGEGSDVIALITALLSLTDSGSGADGTPVISVRVPLTDSGSGADGIPAINVNVPITDAGAGSDAIALITALLSLADAGAGADGTPPAITVRVPLTDSGTGTDDLINILIFLLIQLSDSGSGADSLPAINVNVPITETGAGTDAIALITALLSLTDSGAGVDGIPAINVNVSLTDTASGADDLINIFKIILFQLSDSGSGADSLPAINVKVPITETGAGTDAIALITALLSLTDSGAGADGAPAITVNLSIADSGAGADAIALITALLSLSDSGAGADGTPAINVNVSLTDAAAGADTIALITALIALTDTGAGADNAPAITARVPLTDSGTGTEGTPVINVNVPLTEAAFGADAVALISTLIALWDTGAGADNAPAITAGLSVGDTGAGADGIPTINVNVPIAETGAGADAIALITALLSLVDTGAGADGTPAITVNIPLTDTGAGSDVIAFFAELISVLDSGTGLDVIVRYANADSKRLDIVFAPKKAKTTVTAKKGKITVTAKKAKINITT